MLGFVTDLNNVLRVIRELEHLSTSAQETLECRVEAVLDTIATTQLCAVANEEPFTVEEFVQKTEAKCEEASATLTRFEVTRVVYIEFHDMHSVRQPLLIQKHQH